MSAHAPGRCARPPGIRRSGHGIAHVGAAAAIGATVHAVVNLRRLRIPPQVSRETRAPEHISVVIPVRDEADRIGPCLAALAVAVARYGPAEVIVVDDGSSDGTAEIVQGAWEQLRARSDGRPLRLHRAGRLPTGWLGKAHACQLGADQADSRSTALVFLDADVRLAPDALIRALRQLRDAELQLISPYPRQEAVTGSERLVQPLLQWSWLTFLPLRRAERTSRVSMSAANGQFLAVDAAAYHASGGHRTVRAAVLEDIELLKSFKRNGFRGTVVDGTDLAICRMYDSWPALRDGYSKSLWAAFGSPAAAAAVIAFLLGTYVAPPIAWIRRPRDPLLAVGTAAGLLGRLLISRRVGSRQTDCVAHPVSVALLCALTARSWQQHLRGQLVWRGRRL